MDNKMRIMSEEFINEKTGEKITGLTLMIEGKLKQVFDIIIQKTGGTKTYIEVMHELLVLGIDDQIQKLK